jgi:hypothetical protein
MSRVPGGDGRRGVQRSPEPPGALLEIARIGFVRVGEVSPPALPPDYAPFVSPTPPARGSLTVPVSFHVAERIAQPAHSFFRTGRAWSLAREDGAYVLCIDPAEAGGEVEILVRFSPGDPPAAAAHYRDPAAHPLAYPVDQALLMYLLAAREGVIHHAAGFALEGRGYAFLGRSRAGKTTLSRLLLGRPGWEPLSDDRVVVRRVGAEYLLFGTPWPGEAGLAVNASHPLGGLCFLRQGREHRLEPLTPREAMERLLPVSSVPWFDRDALGPVLALLGSVAAAVPAWELVFANDPTLPAYLARNLPRAAAAG